MKTNPHTPKGAQARSRFIFLEIASYKRCSRPLCSSQTTTPYHTPHTRIRACSVQPGNQKHKSHTTHPQPSPYGHPPMRAMVLLPQDPTVCQTLNRPYPTPHRSRTTTPRGVYPYWVPGKNRRPLSADIPPVSTRRRTSVCATGCTPDKPPPAHTRRQEPVGAP